MPFPKGQHAPKQGEESSSKSCGICGKAIEEDTYVIGEPWAPHVTPSGAACIKLRRGLGLQTVPSAPAWGPGSHTLLRPGCEGAAGQSGLVPQEQLGTSAAAEGATALQLNPRLIWLQTLPSPSCRPLLQVRDGTVPL